MGSLATPLLVSFIGSGGLMGVLVALVKLRGDRDSVAVSQATGANETLVATIGVLEHERDYWRHRYEEASQECARLRQQLTGR